jgi:large subunit ribosomal protein L16
MGSGKGDIDRYVCVIKPGRILFEVIGPNTELVLTALERAAAKLSVRTKVVRKDEK